MQKVNFGIDQINKSDNLKKIKGNVALLAHSASFNSNLIHTAEVLQQVLGARLKKLFGPQHGFVTDVQDNMVETKDFIHPFFKIPVHSLYGEVRSPTDDMLDGIDTFIIDLQDVGTRVYTYIHTLSYVLEACAKKGIRVVVLDRPNPIGGEIIEGNILLPDFKSFVGLHPIPMRHGLTMGEMANFINKYYLQNSCELDIMLMENWNRGDFWDDTEKSWILPSPNLPTWEAAISFVGSVLFEGTNISEGRGTTRSLEIIGHPKLEAFSFSRSFNELLKKNKLDSMYARPQVFMPTFQKFRGEVCQGIQLHTINKTAARPWAVGQLLCQKLSLHLGEDFQWSTTPYEYQFNGLAIDFINGTSEIRDWVESRGTLMELKSIETQGHDEYKQQISTIQLY
jgi:uncharacterized protein YbbC (DUF1343 family)